MGQEKVPGALYYTRSTVIFRLLACTWTPCCHVVRPTETDNKDQDTVKTEFKDCTSYCAISRAFNLVVSCQTIHAGSRIIYIPSTVSL